MYDVLELFVLGVAGIHIDFRLNQQFSSPGLAFVGVAVVVTTVPSVVAMSTIPGEFLRLPQWFLEF